MTEERDVLEVDALFVGAGPASLSGALHLARLIEAHNAAVDAGRAENKLQEPLIAVIEKGRELGAHGISGAVMDPRAARELFPDFDTRIGEFGATPVTEDDVYLLRPDSQIRFPILPPPLKNHGNCILSLGRFVRWLGEQAEASGVEIFPAFPGASLLYEDGRIVGVRTADQGIDKEGRPKRTYQPGVDIRAKVTVLGEGPRGTLTKQLVAEKRLDDDRSPQVYSVGVKEIWEVPGSQARQGRVIHTMGYPLDSKTFGGGFIYYMTEQQVSVGLVVGLDYEDPRTDPHHEFQLFKLHPLVRAVLEGGKLISYGAKAIPEGGFYAVPQLYTAGCLLVGDSAGLLNAQRLKGIHTAMKSGMVAAETVFQALLEDDYSEASLARYETGMKESWVWKELYRVRNFHQGFRRGLWAGLIHAGMQLWTGGQGFGDKPYFEAGHTRMKRRREAAHAPDKYAGLKYDDTYTFSKLNDVYYSGTMHEEDQPCHLVISDYDICNTRCKEEYGNPCQYFCPANVYEMVEQENGDTRLQLNPTNCVHCKTCDIMDPYQIITWVTPEGGGGPNYKNL